MTQNHTYLAGEQRGSPFCARSPQAEHPLCRPALPQLIFPLPAPKPGAALRSSLIFKQLFSVFCQPRAVPAFVSNRFSESCANDTDTWSPPMFPSEHGWSCDPSAAVEEEAVKALGQVFVMLHMASTVTAHPHHAGKGRCSWSHLCHARHLLVLLHGGGCGENGGKETSMGFLTAEGRSS